MLLTPETVRPTPECAIVIDSLLLAGLRPDSLTQDTWGQYSARYVDGVRHPFTREDVLQYVPRHLTFDGSSFDACVRLFRLDTAGFDVSALGAHSARLRAARDLVCDALRNYIVRALCQLVFEYS